MRFPNTISVNTFKAYIHLKNCKKTTNKLLNAFNLDWDINSPDSLKDLCIKSIAEHWLAKPIFSEIEFPEDRNFLLDILDVNFPLSEVCAHIEEDVYWKRCYQQKWTVCPGNLEKKPWIKIFLEKYFAETIEMMKPSEYDPENIINFIELCSPHVQVLKINQLQPSINDTNDHIPFNLILPNLNELRKLDLTYDVKNIGTHFFLGCSSISTNDIKHLIAGIEKCYELREFRLCSSKLEPYMLKGIARALEKGCPFLESIHLPHCRCGDIGLVSFLDALSHESFPNLKDIALTNNFISQEGILELTDAIKNRPIEKLDLRLNPLMSDGIAAVFGVVKDLPIKDLNLACCSIDDTIEVLLLNLLRNNKTLKYLDLSTNKLGNDIGVKMVDVITNESFLLLKKLDVRNTGISNEVKFCIDSIVLENRHEPD